VSVAHLEKKRLVSRRPRVIFFFCHSHSVFKSAVSPNIHVNIMDIVCQMVTPTLRMTMSGHRSGIPRLVLSIAVTVRLSEMVIRYILLYPQSLAPAAVEVVLPVPLPVSLEVTSLSLRAAGVLVEDVVSVVGLALEPSFFSSSSRETPAAAPFVFSNTFSLGCGCIRDLPSVLLDCALTGREKNIEMMK
jgi:hypothetical protein